MHHAIILSLPNRADRRAILFPQLKPLDDIVDFACMTAIKCSPGNIGCALSHQQAVRHAKANNWPLVIVLEDDACIQGTSTQWRETLDILTQHNDWDVCLGGSSAINKQTWEMVSGRKSSNREYLSPFHWTGSQQHIVGIGHILSTPCVIYPQHVYDRVINAPVNDPKFCIDVWINETFNHKLITVPFLAKQTPGYSDIEKRDTNTTHMYDHMEACLQKALRIS